MKRIFLSIISLLVIGAGCGQSTSTSNTTSVNQSGQTVTLNSQEVSKHSTSNDCWMIISGSVYNVTSYLPVHPGGANEILPYCGKDGTNAFATQGGRGSHSSQADSDLSTLLLGQLNATVTL